MSDKKELNSQEMEKVSGGWGRETDNYSANFILTDEELKTLQKAYPDLKIKRSNLQSVAVPKDAGAYFISSKSEGWLDQEQVVDMVTAKLGDISYVTHDGKLFKSL